MIYVMSDIHGQYQTFLKMMELIHFKETDELYILGDIIDRGIQPIEIYRYITAHPNIHLLMGNHEKMMLDFLKKINFELEIDTAVDYETRNAYHLWVQNGGYSTLGQLDDMRYPEKTKCFRFFMNLPYYKILSVNEQNYILCHSGIDFDTYKTVEENLKENVANENILWNRKREYFNIPDNYIVIHGHTPVQSSIYKSDKIVYYMNDKMINVDCGCAGELKLACLRLNDMKEFYVECN